MPDPTRNKAAAEEIVLRIAKVDFDGDSIESEIMRQFIDLDSSGCEFALGENCPCGAYDNMKCFEKGISGIIDRHYGEMERTLVQAAKWAADGGACPAETYGTLNCQRNPDCVYKNDIRCSTIANCWLEYWKKEAEGCHIE